MTPFDRRVRATVYQLLVDQVREVSPQVVADAGGWDRGDVRTSFETLAGAHRLVLTSEGTVRMAHPFAGVPTRYRASIGGDWWHANCAWDALAILSLLGDGEVTGPNGRLWHTFRGEVSPDGIVHLVVPARSFWDDVEFT